MYELPVSMAGEGECHIIESVAISVYVNFHEINSHKTNFYQSNFA